jgi:hypothetical protein
MKPPFNSSNNHGSSLTGGVSGKYNLLNSSNLQKGNNSLQHEFTLQGNNGQHSPRTNNILNGSLDILDTLQINQVKPPAYSHFNNIKELHHKYNNTGNSISPNPL